jgi:hypothetical protein
MSLTPTQQRVLALIRERAAYYGPTRSGERRWLSREANLGRARVATLEALERAGLIEIKSEITTYEVGYGGFGRQGRQTKSARVYYARLTDVGATQG